MDLVRVLITGPTGTPYSRGCFVFDINYPASFPNNPPLVIMTTTGGGTIRWVSLSPTNSPPLVIMGTIRWVTIPY